MVYLIDDSALSIVYPDLTEAERNTLNGRISTLVEDYLNTKFEIIEYEDETYDSKDRLTLRHMPIVSVESLVDNDEDLVEDEDFFVYDNQIVIVSPSEVRKAILISYTAGNDYTTPISMVAEVALDIARYWKFKQDEEGMLFYASQTFEERSYKVHPDLTESKIIKRLSNWAQPYPSESGKGNIRVGVI